MKKGPKNIQKPPQWKPLTTRDRSIIEAALGGFENARRHCLRELPLASFFIIFNAI